MNGTEKVFRHDLNIEAWTLDDTCNVTMIMTMTKKNTVYIVFRKAFMFGSQVSESVESGNTWPSRLEHAHENTSISNLVFLDYTKRTSPETRAAKIEVQ